MFRASLISAGLALGLATPAAVQAGEMGWRATPMAGGWSSAMPASGQIYGPSLGPSPMGRDRIRAKPRHRRHEAADSAMDRGGDAAFRSKRVEPGWSTGDRFGMKATGWGTGAAGGLAGGHNP